MFNQDGSLEFKEGSYSGYKEDFPVFLSFLNNDVIKNHL